MKHTKDRKHGNFTQISNDVLNDPKLSWKAKGLFAYLLSKPDDWDYVMDVMEMDSTDGIKSLRSGLKELEANNYLKRTRKRLPNGKFTYDYVVSVENISKSVLVVGLKRHALFGHTVEMDVPSFVAQSKKACKAIDAYCTLCGQKEYLSSDSLSDGQWGEVMGHIDGLKPKNIYEQIWSIDKALYSGKDLEPNSVNLLTFLGSK